MGDEMARRRHTPEQIITKLREGNDAMAQGPTTAADRKDAAEAERLASHGL